MPKKKALDFPKWLETLIIVALLVMAVIECWHDQWVWGAIFGIVGVAFGIGLLVRLFSGDNHGEKVIPSPQNPKRIIVAITGASGALYAERLLETLAANNIEIFLIVSTIGRRLLHDELGMESGGSLDLAALAGRDDHHITLLPYKDVGACIASGSFKNDGIVVIPCSNNKLAEFAHGLGDNLISRAVQVALKEKRRVIIVHRETPLGLIEIKNMLALAEAGAILCPANPGFYTLPRTIDDLVNMVIGRVLDLLDIDHKLHERWDGKGPLPEKTIDSPSDIS